MPRVKSFDEEEMLKRAIDVFWKKGYHHTSIQDLVDHLGLTRASIYNAFTDKETLFQLAFDLYRNQNIERLTKFFNQEKNVKKGFIKLFEETIDDSVIDDSRKGCLVVNTTTELIPGDDKVLVAVQKNKEAFEKLFLTFLKKGEKENQFPKGKDLKSIASLLFTFHNGLRVIGKIKPFKVEMTNTVSQLLKLLD